VTGAPDATGATAVGRRRAVLALGSNQGDRLAALQGAVEALAGTPGLTVVAVSPVYETDPVGGPEQPDYLNAVVLVEGDLAPRALLERSLTVEAAFARTRDVRWGPRTLDVDVVAVGELVEERRAGRVDQPDARADELERSRVREPARRRLRDVDDRADTGSCELLGRHAVEVGVVDDRDLVGA